MKEDRRVRKNAPANSTGRSESGDQAATNGNNTQNESVPMEDGSADNESGEGGAVVIKPSTIQLV